MLAHNLESQNLNLAVTEACLAISELSSLDASPLDLMQSPILQQLSAQMNEGLPLKFLLPAFPAKSPSRQKTAGVLPDLGEVIALQALNRMCARIAQFYAPGVQVLICSDGRIFSDVVGVDDETIDQYQASIDTIIAEFSLHHLTTFAMDDLFPNLKGNDLRERVLWQFGKCPEEIRHLVLNDSDSQRLFNGLHKFMVEDRLGCHEGKSKNQINKETKPVTYELMRRSDAWSQLLNHYHKGALRLSIHPYPLTHEKFGVRLVNTSSKWATPWHNVTVRIEGRYELMHLTEAQKLVPLRKTSEVSMSTSKSEGISVLKDVVMNDTELLEHALKLSQRSGTLQERLLHWDFGPIMQMRYDTGAANYLFSNEDVPFHWDGAFHQEPAKLLFYCLESSGTGGETLFTNTELLWDALSAAEKSECQAVRLRYQTEKKAHYGGEINVPLVQKHPVTGRVILRLAEEVETHLNPVKLEVTGISDPQGFYQTMRAKLYQPNFLVEHEWRSGDLLVCDNFTFLHGRRPLGQNLGRSFKRVQIL